MAKNEIIIKAVTLQGLSYAQTAKKYGVSKTLVHRLVNRYKQEGETAFKPRKSTPKNQPTKTPDNIRSRVLELRQQLTKIGLDAGPESLKDYLTAENIKISKTTIWRILKQENQITPQPQKRPHTSFIRFAADRPNETWQSDFTHWPLKTGQDTEIIAWLDDHSRYLLHISCHYRVTGKIVTETFTKTALIHGYPASTLTDNGNVYTTRYAGRSDKKSKNAFETLLALEGITQKNGRPYKPTTQGKIERFWKTLKQHLATNQKAANLEELQQQLNNFKTFYNDHRPHRSINRKTPAFAYTLIPKAEPGPQTEENIWRVRKDKVDNHGKVSLRWENKMLHLGIGHKHNRKEVIIMQHGLEITVITPDGEVISEHKINPKKGYQPKK